MRSHTITSGYAWWIKLVSATVAERSIFDPVIQHSKSNCMLCFLKWTYLKFKIAKLLNYLWLFKICSHITESDAAFTESGSEYTDKHLVRLCRDYHVSVFSLEVARREAIHSRRSICVASSKCWNSEVYNGIWLA